MATGDQPFHAPTPADQIAALLHLRPQPPGAVRDGLPPRFDEIVARCLERDAERRYQRARELRDDLELLRLEVRSGSDSARVPFAASRSAGPRALAVLPFENLSGEEEYFVNGMTDALISSLSHLGRVRVISRQSVMRYKGSDKPLPVISRELGVDVVLTGSVLRAGSRVRISTQLVQAEPEQQLWAESYNRDVQDVLALQDEVAREVASQVRLELTEQERSRLMGARQVDPAVYELYLQGRFHWDKRTPEGLRKAIEYFAKAIAADPLYAAAHAGLADAYALLAYFRHEPWEETFGKARAAASRALAIDGSLAEAHASLGFVLLFHDWDGPGAERGFRRAIELNPSYASAHHWLWGHLASVGRLREAGQHLRIARQLNPFSPTIAAGAAAHSRMLRDLTRSVEQCRKAIDLEPGYALSHDYLWMALHLLGRWEEAFEEHQRTLLLLGLSTVAERAKRAYASSGYRPALAEAAEALAAEAGMGSVKAPVHMITETYALSGETSRAIEWLETGVERREPFVIWLQQLPELDSLRDSPRFQELAERVVRERSHETLL
jgi:TolB-like protein/Flp pilus assembly protein TadD